MSPTRISCAPLGATQVRSGCAPDIARLRELVGIRRVLRQQLGGHRPGDRALACPAGAVKQIRVRGLAARRERGAEHRPGVWMAFQFREHISMLAPDTLGPDHHGSGQADHDRGDRRGGQVDARRRPRGDPRRARDCRAAPARAGRGPGSRAHPRAGHRSRAANRRACRSAALRRRSRAARRGGAASAAGTTGLGCCSIGSWTHRSPTRAAAVGSVSMRSATSTSSRSRDCDPIARCCS